MTVQAKPCFITLQLPSGSFKVKHRFGHIVDPTDKRDFDYCATLSMPYGSLSVPYGIDIKSPVSIDLTEYFRPISDQLQFPSCTANACADTWEAVIAIDKVINKRMSLSYAVSSTPDMSRMFMWWNGRREMDPDQSWNPDSGCYNRLVVDSLARFGAATEATWPYIVENATRRPSLRAYREAVGYVCGNYYAITGSGSSRKAALISALTNKHPVVFGTAVEKSFLEYRGGIVPIPSTEIIGLHAMAVVGYDSTKAAFRVRNSWSQYWGEDGYCWLAEEYVLNPCSNSFWVMTRGFA